jgi:ABC-type cobalamin/Fe3+-siderophores transport system ATPase subunit
MELVYLWVQEYKNIYKQGFNFSPRFECTFHDKYDKDGNLENDCKLEIKPKEHIENFFGDNINVTAIVGKNGSGKSSLLHSLIEANDVFFSLSPSVQHEFIMCYIDDGEKILVTNITLDNKTEFILEKYKSDKDGNYPSHPFYLLHYDSSLTYFQRYRNKKTSIITIGNFTPYKDKKNMPLYYKYIDLIPNKDIPLNELAKEENKNIIYYIINPNKFINSFFEPRTIFINSFDDSICDTCETFEDLQVYSLKKYLIVVLEKALTQINEKQLKDDILSNDKSKSENIEIVGDFPLSEIIDQLDSIIDLEEILKLIYSKILPINGNFYIKSLSLEIRENILFKIEELRKYITISLQTTNKNDLIIKIEGSFQININLLKENLIPFILNMEPFLNVVFFDENRDISYDNLSSGEKELLRIRFYLEKIINSHNLKNTIILMDEINNYLHPNWQKLLMEYLINIFKNKEYNIHFILTTHSPFILSDIPKQNIIFLDKDEKGNCKVVINGLKEKKQTFGANIHTLLSDSFFMEDGLMGEFAKGKINEIKKLYQLTQNENIQKRLKEEKIKELAQKAFNRRKDRLWQIQKIIGEPFLQKVIKNYLNELELLFSDDNTLIEKELADIEKRRIYLESLKNAKN